MLALMGVYVITDGLSFRPGGHLLQTTPEANRPQ
jgi:hypothetical protein